MCTSLLLPDDQVSALSMLRGIAGLLILGIVGRLLMGVMMRAALDSVLAVGVLHQIFDASNNGGFVDSLLDGADAGTMTQFAAVILTVLVAGWLLWRRPGVFAKRQIPLLFPKSRGDRIEHHFRGPDPNARRDVGPWRRRRRHCDVLRIPAELNAPRSTPGEPTDSNTPRLRPGYGGCRSPRPVDSRCSRPSATLTQADV